MSLGMDVGLDPGAFVLDEDTALSSPPKKKLGAQSSPNFGPYLLWPNGRSSQLLLSSCCVVAVVGTDENRVDGNGDPMRHSVCSPRA